MFRLFRSPVTPLVAMTMIMALSSSKISCVASLKLNRSRGACGLGGRRCDKAEKAMQRRKIMFKRPPRSGTDEQNNDIVEGKLTTLKDLYHDGQRNNNGTGRNGQPVHGSLQYVTMEEASYRMFKDVRRTSKGVRQSTAPWTDFR
jgi:hypothetical protein